MGATPVGGVRERFPCYTYAIQSFDISGIRIITQTFVTAGMKEMADQKEYSSLDMVFPFVVALLNRTLENFQNPGLTNFHVLYCDIFKHFTIAALKPEVQKICCCM